MAGCRACGEVQFVSGQGRTGLGGLPALHGVGLDHYDRDVGNRILDEGFRRGNPARRVW
jgi:hypothetical protein